MKRLGLMFLLAVCALVLLLPLRALADVVVEPNNDFYEKHRDECYSLNRSFYANGEAGYVTFKKEPGSGREVSHIENGEVIYIMCTYNHKGAEWGVSEVYANDKYEYSWVLMDDLIIKYDYLSFDEEHADEIYEYTGENDMLFETDDIVFWTWPGSGEIEWTLYANWREDEADENFFDVYKAYTDSQGREWGYFGYVYGVKNVWACLDDPGNTNIESFNPPPEPEVWPPVTPPQVKSLPIPMFAIILVIVLSAGTVVLIRVLRKPSEK